MPANLQRAAIAVVLGLIGPLLLLGGFNVKAVHGASMPRSPVLSASNSTKRIASVTGPAALTGTVMAGDIGIAAVTFDITKQSASTWQKRLKLVFQNSAGSDNLVDFPILVTLKNDGSVRDIYADTQNAGQDIRFVDPDGTLLDYEIEQWNESGNSYIWVKVPQIDANSSDDHIWLYYGNPDAADAQTPAAVWSNNYRAVWHLNNDLDDAVGPNNAESATTSVAAGWIAQGRSFRKNQPDYINVGSDDSIDNVFGSGGTLMAWLRPIDYGTEGTQAQGFGRILDKSDTIFNDNGWAFEMYGGKQSIRFGRDYEDNRGSWYPAVTVLTNTWSLVGVTFNDATPTQNPNFYVNGIFHAGISELDKSGSPVSDAGEDLFIGNFEDLNRSFNGVIDEVRVANTIRSPAWMNAQYRSMTDVLLSYESPQPVASEPGGIVGAPLTYTLTITSQNAGPRTNVQITDTVPDGAFFISVGSGGALIGNSVQWTLASVPGAGTAAVTFVVTTCQLSLLNDSYQVIGSTQGDTSPPGLPVISLLTPPTLTANFTVTPPAGTVNTTFNFASTSTTNGGPIVAWAWDFDDGNTASGATTTHQYSAAGTYNVTLTVTDTCGYTATVTKPVDVIVLDVSLDKSATPTTVLAGERLTYTLVVQNSGSQAITGLTITDPTPPQTVYVPDSATVQPVGSGTVGNPPALLTSGTIPAGGSITVTFGVTVTLPLTTGTTIANTATVSAATLLESVTDTVTVTVNAPPGISLTKSGPALAAIGDTIPFSFTVTNTGRSRLQIQGLVDDYAGPGTLVGGDVNGNGWLDLDETWRYAASYTVTAADPDPLVNTGRITATDAAGAQVTASASHSTDLVTGPVLTLQKEGPATAVVGEVITFIFRVSHAPQSSNSPLENVTVVDDYAGPATFVSGDTNPNGLLDAGETWVFQANYTVSPKAPDPLVNTGQVTANDSMNRTAVATDTHSTNLSGFDPRLFIDKDGPPEVRIGGTAHYTFTVVNVDLLALFLYNLEGVTINSVGDGSSITLTDVSDDRITNVTYLRGDRNGNGLLDGGEAWTYIGSQQITASGLDFITNTATATGRDQDGQTLQDQDSHVTDILHRPILTLTGSGPAEVQAGDPVNFTVSIRHDAASDNSPVSSLVVSDTRHGAVVTFTGGDNGNGQLDGGETWLYTIGYQTTMWDYGTLNYSRWAQGVDVDREPLALSDPYQLTVNNPNLKLYYMPVIIKNSNP